MTMAGMSIFDISGRAMSAQLVSLNATASNMANAGAVAGTPEEAYKARRPIFQTAFDRAQSSNATVDAVDVVQDRTAPTKRYDPGHPLADKDGYVYYPNVNVVEEMADMISASRAFQTNTEMMNTAKTMLQKVLTLGQ